jgi:outer membrane protein assembly factor BamD
VVFDYAPINKPQAMIALCQSSWKSFVSLGYQRSRPFLVVALLSLILFGLSACGSWRTHEEEIENASVERTYEICRQAVDKGNYDRATRDLKRLIGRFPFGNYTEIAQLDLAFAQSKLGDSDEALASINRFIKTYPTHENADYAYYLRGLINAERQNTLVDRLVPADRGTHDQKTNKQAFLDFADMLKRYPESKYAPDARARMVVLRGLLADSELRVAQYYLRRGAYVGALNRAKLVVESYQQSTQSYDALAVMIASYQGLGQQQLAQDSEAVLKLNAPDHAYFTGAKKSGRWWLFGR